jgi:GNAT superfamily N-acetyltransferase
VKGEIAKPDEDTDNDETKRDHMITLNDHLPDKDSYLKLFGTTGWNEEYHANAEDLARALRNSWIAISAYDGDRLVGFGRVVSDQVLHAMIYDMIVHPEYQGKGIGRMILDALVSRCRQHGINDVQLFCATGKRAFYEKNGFEARSVEAPGMQLKTEA